MSKKREIYCHFSFRRPKGKNYCLFACAAYGDSEGKELLDRVTRAYPLWENHQHITAIQSYWHALQCIWEWQSELIRNNITNVFLVTNNSTLEGWIINPKHNKNYTGWMNKAVEHFKIAGSKELKVTVGILEARDSEKSHKYCKEELLKNKIPTEKQIAEYRLDVGEFVTMDMIADEDKPKDNGIEEL